MLDDAHGDAQPNVAHLCCMHCERPSPISHCLSLKVRYECADNLAKLHGPQRFVALRSLTNLLGRNHDRIRAAVNVHAHQECQVERLGLSFKAQRSRVAHQRKVTGAQLLVFHLALVAQQIVPALTCAGIT